MLKEIVISGGGVLRPHGLDSEPLHISRGAVAEATGSAARSIDATGKLVLPGLVDIHGDAFERQIMPRPGVMFDLHIALADTDRQLVSNGITTAFHGVTWSWELGLRGTQSARAVVDAIETVRPHLAADTRIHLRQETFNLDAEAELSDWIGARRIDLLAFNDHMSGTITARSRPDKLTVMVQRSGLSKEDFDALLDRTYARRDEVAGSVSRLADVCAAAGVAALSHDDMSPQQRAWYRDLGCSIAEFPIDETTAAAAAESGDQIVFGAPNVIRGGSHTGCPSAAEMVSRRMCTILASDYYYPALLAAPFALERTSGLDIAEAWRLVSLNPARAVGLRDRGELSPGQRADVIVVDVSRAQPKVVLTIVAGRIAQCSDTTLLTS